MIGKRRLAGFLAKKRGEQFERFFESRARMQKIVCIRIPDGCKQLGPTKIMRVRTPFDYILGYEGRVCFCDLKSFDSDRITKSQLVDHQVECLKKLEPHALAGYFCFFRKTEKFVFFNVSKLEGLEAFGSLKEADGVLLGNLLQNDFTKVFEI